MKENRLKSLFKNKHIVEVDYFHDAPIKIFLIVFTPMLIQSILGIFISGITSAINAEFAGKTYFAVVGAMTQANTFINMVLASSRIASWAKFSSYYHTDRRLSCKYYIQSLYSTLALWAVLFIVICVFPDQILGFLNIPQEIHDAAKLYLFISVIMVLVTEFYAITSSISNGTSGFWKIFTLSIASTLISLGSTYLLLEVFKLGFVGALTVGFPSSVILIIVSLVFISKNKVFDKFLPSDFIPDLQTILSVIAYGAPIMIQNLFANGGYLIVSVVANKTLPIDIIAATAVLLPFSSPLVYIGTVITYFVPTNYRAGNPDRVKKMLRTTLIITLAYSVLASIVSISIAEPFFAARFPDNPMMAVYGKQFWICYCTGFFGLGLIYNFRYMFELTGYSKITVISGFCELASSLFIAFYLIPHFAADPKLTGVGFMLSPGLTQLFAGVVNMIIYLFMRKKIYARCDSFGHSVRDIPEMRENRG